MVGKIKRIRQKLHQDAVKVGESNLEKAPLLSEAKPFALPGVIKPFDVDKNDKSTDVTFKGSFPAGIFAGTKITAETLVQTLKYDEPPKSTPLTTSQPAAAGGGEKRQQTKKERMKERRERWLNKISAIKTAREQHVAQVKRKATPVVGDMKPLVDALPELSQLTASTASGTAMATASTSTPSSSRAAKRAKADKAATKKRPPGSINLSKMKPAQKRKLVASEVSWFSEAVKSSSLKSSSSSSVNPLAAITEQLRKRLKQDEEQSG
ncbi:protein FAM207A isoform X2 [Engraulis encrasicolus]|uniref:protein FAM207A isoform X2 n=1 Tax=Engraulis encrasicolus TaxID=184585 RepID=UPI002FD29D3A